MRRHSSWARKAKSVAGSRLSAEAVAVMPFRATENEAREGGPQFRDDHKTSSPLRPQLCRSNLAFLHSNIFQVTQPHHR